MNYLNACLFGGVIFLALILAVRAGICLLATGIESLLAFFLNFSSDDWFADTITHVQGCVVGKQCPFEHDRLHRVLEKAQWELMKIFNNNRVVIFFTEWFKNFIQVFFTRRLFLCKVEDKVSDFFSQLFSVEL